MIMTAQSEQRDERISALMDGEITDSEIDRALSDLRQDTELNARWGRYHLVSDSLRNDLADSIDPHLAGRINAAIDAEPIYTAAHHWRRKPAPEWLRQAGGLAVAASVTAVAILGAQALYQNEAEGIPVGAATVAAAVDTHTSHGRTR